MTDDHHGLDTSRPHPARRYDYWLGGKDNYAADRESGDAAAKAFPSIRIAARQNRMFLQRAVQHVTAEAGIRQFLDIGTGLPTANNTHEVAQSIAPESRVLYVDNDPIVLVHARALLTSGAEGVTAYADADLRDPDTILKAPQLRETLNLSRPVAMLLVAVLHFLTDDDAPHAVVKRLTDELPAGSFVVLSHAAGDLLTEEDRTRVQTMFLPGSKHGPFRMRNRAQIAAFAEGLDLIEPGLVPVQRWRCEPGTEVPADDQVGMYGFVARKRA